MAEALETARYNLRGDTWLELRESERATRSALCLQALEAAGILRRVAQLEAEAARVPELSATLARRDAELAATVADRDAEVAATVADRDAEVSRLRREHAEELERAQLQHASQVAALETRVNETKAELMEARDAHQSARAAVLRLEDQITAVRAELDQAGATSRDVQARARLAEARAASAETRADTADRRADAAEVRAAVSAQLSPVHQFQTHDDQSPRPSADSGATPTGVPQPRSAMSRLWPRHSRPGR